MENQWVFTSWRLICTFLGMLCFWSRKQIVWQMRYSTEFRWADTLS
jgi:hypothetical protein